MTLQRSLCRALCVSLLLWGPAALQAAPAMALGSTPKYPADFSHFDYVNADAPKGGELTLSSVGSFDSFNPFILKGITADGITELMFETLMVKSMDEPFSLYGLIADDAVLADDGLSVTFHINPAARFSDGTTIMAEDVKFSFDTLKGDDAHPYYRFYWADITAAVVVDPAHVRFEFAKKNPELHMIIADMQVFPRHWLGESSLAEMGKEPPIGSGPYLIERFDLGKTITYKRNPDYWGASLPVRRGMYNFDRVTFKVYRDSTVALEAFKAGEFDFISVYNSKQWARDYEGGRFDTGEIVKTTFPHANNAGMQGFVFNLRRAKFQDIRVRRALSLALDFEWANAKLFYDQYTRCDSYFSNSPLAASGIPEGDELALLEPYRAQLPRELFTQPWTPSTTLPPHSLRENLREARQLLTEAGYQIKDGKLVDAKGNPFTFEIILVQKAFERIVAPYARNLAVLGIDIDYRTIDPALYKERTDAFDFDVVVSTYPQSLSPGNELRNMFHSQVANEKGSRNLMGLQDPVVDALVDKVIYAADRHTLETAVHALDRVLLYGEYVVPNWYIPYHRVAFWKGLQHVGTPPLYYGATDWALSQWWREPARP